MHSLLPRRRWCLRRMFALPLDAGLESSDDLPNAVIETHLTNRLLVGVKPTCSGHAPIVRV
jgi:hypothetical protein